MVTLTRCIDGGQLQDPELTRRLKCISLAAEADSLVEDEGHFDDKSDLFLFEEENKRPAPGQCEGCSLHANTAKNDIITFSESQNKCFLSEDFASRSPFSHRILDRDTLRVTCLRSMSSEVHPKSQGGVYFSTESEHVLSFLFSLQDSKSRGFQRKYSIFVMYDKSKRPFSNFNFLIKNITVIIANLQRKARAVYASELTPVATRNNRSIILDKVVSAGKNLNYFEELFEDRDSWSTSKSKIKARSLGEITGDCNIFYTLHLQFAAILGEILRRDKENASLALNYPIDLSEVGLISNFFCNDYSKLRQLYSLTGRANFVTIAANVVIGNRVIVFDSNQKGRTQEVVGMLAKLLPQERIEVQTEEEFDARNHSLSPNDSNLLGVCAKFQSADVNKLMADFYLCVEIVDRIKERYTLKVHCCDEIAAVNVPTFVKKVEELLQVVFISDVTLGKRIDEMKFEWMNKSKMFLSNVPRLNVAEVGIVKRVLKVSDNDLQMMQFWSKVFVNK